jgi:hypothetical protein
MKLAFETNIFCPVVLEQPYRTPREGLEIVKMVFPVKTVLLQINFGKSQKLLGAKSGVFQFDNGLLYLKHLDRGHSLNWSIAIMEEPIVQPQFRPFSPQLYVTFSVFLQNNRGYLAF